MSEIDFEAQLQAIAGGMNYPPTPNLAASVTARLRALYPSPFRARTFAWSLTVVLILLSSLMLIPPARAAILEFIQIGAVKIFRIEPTPVPPLQHEPPAQMFPVTATPVAIQTPLVPMLQHMSGEVTLQQAQEKVTYPLLLPSYPSDLGPPDHVFVQYADGPMAILVWEEPQHPDRVLLSLHFLPSGSWAIKKLEPQVVQETTVDGQPAFWTTGPYPMMLENGEMQFVRMINGHVLIWEEGTVTYRLETHDTLEEAVRIAESLAPIP